MNMHVNKKPTGRLALHIPPLDINEVRLAALEPNGENALAQRMRNKLESENSGVYGAQMEITRGDRKIARLMRELARFDRMLGRTDVFWTRITAEREFRQPLYYYVAASLQAVLAGFALYASNTVGVAYIVRSGSDMYATDPSGASLFMGAAVLGSVALKAIDASLTPGLFKKLFFAVMSVIGMTCLTAWVVTLALVFSPETGASAWLMAGISNTRLPAITLVLTHLVADITLGCITLAAAEKLLLGGRKQIEVDNPAYAHTKKLGNAIENQIEIVEDAIAEAEDFLRAFEAAARAVEDKARFAVRLEIGRARNAQEAAVAKANRDFLNPEGD